MTVHHLDRAEHDRPNLLRLALADLYKADVLKKLIDSAAQGDVDAFLGAIAQAVWPGAWVDALRAVVSLGSVPRATQDSFLGAWQGSASQPFGLRRVLTLDLLNQDALLLDGLAVLLPPVQPEPKPVTVYRVEPLDAYENGHVGLWWTGERSLAPMVSVAGSAFHEWGDAPVVLLSAEAPAAAVVYCADDLEVLLDPRQLGQVRVVGVVNEDREDEPVRMAKENPKDALTA